MEKRPAMSDLTHKISQRVHALAWRSWGAKAIVTCIGILFLVSSVSKMLDMALFIRQIKAYGILSGHVAVTAVAWQIVVMEWLLGVALVLHYHPRRSLSAAAVVLVAFTGLTTWAWMGDVVKDCGCFGGFFRHSPGQKAVENMLVLAAVFIAWKGSRPSRTERYGARAWAMTIACAGGLAVTVFSATPQLHQNDQASHPPAVELSGIQVEGLEYVDLRLGSYLVVLIGVDCEHCQEAVPALNMLAQDLDSQMILAVCTNAEDECIEFVQKYQPLFPVGRVTENVFRKLLDEGSPPRILLVNNGQVLKIWDGVVPRKEEIGLA